LVTVLWFLSGAALVAAVVALARARRLAKRVERLTESYWDLRYEHGQLRARVARLDPDEPAAPATDAAKAPAGSFVPLSSLKR
jgi:hypothetical protein